MASFREGIFGLLALRLHESEQELCGRRRRSRSSDSSSAIAVVAVAGEGVGVPQQLQLLLRTILSLTCLFPDCRRFFQSIMNLQPLS